MPGDCCYDIHPVLETNFRSLCISFPGSKNKTTPVPQISFHKWESACMKFATSQPEKYSTYYIFICHFAYLTLIHFFKNTISVERINVESACSLHASFGFLPHIQNINSRLNEKLLNEKFIFYMTWNLTWIAEVSCDLMQQTVISPPQIPNCTAAKVSNFKARAVFVFSSPTYKIWVWLYLVYRLL